ncbi:hypothetical protein RchiOBHm_Chr5g0065471 [Rosa chinensis]|uniref:Uncharacterized protein n=1 Tax=Rosa chinensis TaxID=74649 RepID=A0A2P6QIZ5_ROSCH|nr:hypothetical protein RchiOBHm_Chr5g0065471 [Rosa chinensis]
MLRECRHSLGLRLGFRLGFRIKISTGVSILQPWNKMPEIGKLPWRFLAVRNCNELGIPLSAAYLEPHGDVFFVFSGSNSVYHGDGVYRGLAGA